MSNCFRRVLICVSLLMLVVVGSASAQNAQTRAGLWGGVGLGWGSLGCQDCDGREGGLSGNAYLGGTLSSKVLLGAMSAGWTKEEDGVTVSVASLAAVVRFYPSATGGFFLLGGLGLGKISADVSGFGSASETGASAILGLGYDIRVGKNVSLTPYWNGVGVSASNDSDANFGQIGLGITIH